MSFPDFAAADLVAETTDTTGTGTYSLRGALAGCFGFLTAYNDGDSVSYIATDGPNVEAGTGSLTAGNPDTLSRTTILASSNGGNAVNWSGKTRPIIRAASNSSRLWAPTCYLAGPTAGGRLPIASERLFRIPLPYIAHIPMDFTGSLAYVDIQATATATFTMYKNLSTVVGHIIFTSGSFTGTFTGGSINFAIGDTFDLVAPTVQDTTLAGFGVTIFGTRDAL